ncbi:PREDICTED: myeloid differentiation primary response protein MyD88 [Polistes dominula]|uniref:Myeloid differentiation primary response protein MyD88 n=1 Tax=Polistes dominula TaxID=743375 RepID=A0ABM1I4F7_POLDO|nr:PREDICTED: myeloid differentiation primary response protein MyD88 [Polistes dominula]
MDLSSVPITALSLRTKNAISNLLNPTKYILSDNGLPRDWRGLAHLANIKGELLPFVSSHSDPTEYILNTIAKKTNDNNIANFQCMLSTLERWDIIDDIQEFIEEDTEKYLKSIKNAQTTAEAIEETVDSKIITVDDLYRIRRGLKNQIYDALVLYADEDIAFAYEMIKKLENFDIKLCIKDRDLIGGISFEHEAVMTLISERCNRMIIIISPNFLKSSANQFFMNYAQAVSIDKRQRKIIPCIYKKCVLPPQLSYMFVLDYTKVGLYDFWGRLRDSIQVSNKLQNENMTKEIKIDNHLTTCLSSSDNLNDSVKVPNKLNDGDMKEIKSENKETTSYIPVLNKLNNDYIKENMEENQETIPYLPSLNNLSTLSLTIDSTEISKEKSKEKKSSRKKSKHMNILKKILLKS